MKIWIKPTFTPPSMDFNKTLNEVLNWILLISLILGGMSVCIGIVEAISLNQTEMIFLYIGFFLPILFANIFKNKISYKLRAILLLTSVYLLSIANIVGYGFSGAGIPLFYCLAILATLLFDLRAGFIAIAFSVLPMAVVGWLMVNSKLSMGVDLMYISTLPISWVTATGVLIFLGGILIMSLSTVQKNLLLSVKYNHEQAKTLDEMNRKLNDLNQYLEDKVKARTQQLRVANQELEAFSYSVSHDLRAPLRAMNGFSNILMEEYREALPEEAQHYLDLIGNNSNKMSELINGLLLFSRTGKQALKISKVSCMGMVKQILADLRSEQVGSEIEIKLGRLPACQADPTLLKQVWVNLLYNAFKFTKWKDNARVEISSKKINGETVYFVKDNGVGFDMSYVDKLFGVFQRLHSEAEFEGTGVGLAIVQRIITRHGGKIWAEAEVDNGAAFYFTVGGRSE